MRCRGVDDLTVVTRFRLKEPMEFEPKQRMPGANALRKLLGNWESELEFGGVKKVPTYGVTHLKSGFG
ncbi:hypothetical protein TNCV_561171 [Trichonephila clavipes]|uniref:Uncharacterized protein n=1 Tax=Trichonephila clavipes TaxID=2585209 RepID=A0A8X6VGB2_TRICX|nr:hypothetical protein TNCV_561171 [Trichonephila clavipes]